MGLLIKTFAVPLHQIGCSLREITILAGLGVQLSHGAI